MERNRLSVRDMCFIAIFTALIIAVVPIRIPMPTGVPMTLQTFVIPLAGVVLGSRRGTYSVLVYLLLGVVGLPIFAGPVPGGIGAILGMTGGFILSFPFMAWAAGRGAGKRSVLWLTLWLVIGMAVNFLCGMVQFMIVTGSGLEVAFLGVVLPFLLGDAIKLVLLVILGPQVRRLLERSGVLV